MLVLHHRQLTLLILCRFNTQPDAHTPPLTQTLVTHEIIIIIIKNMKSDLDFFFLYREDSHSIFKKGDNTKLARVEGNLGARSCPSASCLPATTANTGWNGMQHCLPRGCQQYKLVANFLHLE